MPLPTPKKDESQDTFMGRCMAFMSEENSKKPEGKKRERKQMVAICFSQFKNKGSKSEEAEKIEIASEKFIEKFKEKYPQYAKYFE